MARLKTALLSFFLLDLAVFGQAGAIRGKVLDVSDRAIVGAAVEANNARTRVAYGDPAFARNVRIKAAV